MLKLLWSLTKGAGVVVCAAVRAKEDLGWNKVCSEQGLSAYAIGILQSAATCGHLYQIEMR